MSSLDIGSIAFCSGLAGLMRRMMWSLAYSSLIAHVQSAERPVWILRIVFLLSGLAGRRAMPAGATTIVPR